MSPQNLMAKLMSTCNSASTHRTTGTTPLLRLRAEHGHVWARFRRNLAQRHHGRPSNIQASLSSLPYSSAGQSWHWSTWVCNCATRTCCPRWKSEVAPPVHPSNPWYSILVSPDHVQE